MRNLKGNKDAGNLFRENFSKDVFLLLRALTRARGWESVCSRETW